MFTPDRIYQVELLDAGAGTEEDVARNLLDLRRVNRWLGGLRAVLGAFRRELGKADHHISVLDVGTGSADIPEAISRWCGQQGLTSAITAVDNSFRNLRIARQHFGLSKTVDLVQADSGSLPFPDRTFDFVTASMFLHHFRDEDVVRHLSDFARLARRAIIVNDLVRDLVPYYFTRLLGPITTTSFLTRNDAPVSVLRGFTVADLTRYATCAGLENVSLRRVFPYRVLLVARTRDKGSARSI
jgi:SAM-dependent methyltransferase